MFRTHADAQIPTGDFYDGEAQLWSVVEHSLQVPWFYVTLAERRGEQTTKTMVLVHEIYAFEALLADQCEMIEVADIQLVSPPHLNNGDRWLMEPLIELTVICRDESFGYIYSVAGGKKYLDGVIRRNIAGVPESARTIYRI